MAQSTISKSRQFNLPTSGMTGLGADPAGNLSYVIGLLGQLISKAPDASTSPISMAEGAGEKVGREAKQILSPYQKGVEKALKTAGEQQATEALMEKVPPQYIEQQAGLNQQQLQNEQQDRTGVLKNLLSILYSPGGMQSDNNYKPPSMFGGFIKPTPSDQSILMQTYGIRPEVALQQEVETLKSVLSNAGKDKVDPLAGENAGKFSMAMEGLDAINQIDQMLFSNSSQASGLVLSGKITPNFFKSQESRRYQALIEQVIQLKTRSETGAAMQPSELKSASKRYEPRIGDSVETMKKRLSPLGKYFDRTINVMDPTGTHRQRATQSEKIASLLQTLITEKRNRKSGGGI